MKIERFRPDIMMHTHPLGAYVAFEDHQEAMDQAAKKILMLQQQLQDLKGAK